MIILTLKKKMNSMMTLSETAMKGIFDFQPEIPKLFETNYK